MSINSISSLTSATSSCSTSQLSEETKQKLIALGIDPTNIKTELQAQNIIKQVEALKSQNKTASSTQKGQASNNEILAAAKQLATQVGVNVSKTDTIDDILDNISAAIGKMDSKEPNTKYYQERLAVIQSEYAQNQMSLSSLNNMMAAVATSNKIALGLN